MSDHDVGYKKPPKSTQFKKGQTGNPKGRKKGAKSLKTVLKQELSSKITVTEDGKSRKISKLEALAKRLVSQALAGHPRAVAELLKQVNTHLADADPGRLDELPVREEDLEILNSFARRVARNIEDQDSGGSE